MKIQSEKMLSMEDVRILCIRENWYTLGDVQAYGKMLKMANSEHVTNKLLYKIALDIAEHSDIDDYLKSGHNYKEIIEHIMYLLNRQCFESFVIIDD